MGLSLMGISVLLFYLLWGLMNALTESSHSTCKCAAGTCPMENIFPAEAYVGIAVVALLFFIGLYLTIQPSSVVQSSNNWKSNSKKLRGDEKAIYNLLIDSNGVLFQSELVEKTSYPKAKVSRILDKLEAQDLLERKRRGLSNAVVLKNT